MIRALVVVVPHNGRPSAGLSASASSGAEGASGALVARRARSVYALPRLGSAYAVASTSDHNFTEFCE